LITYLYIEDGIGDILDLRFFMGAGFDADHYLVVANLGKDW
jgi:hypothetical protein